MKEQLYKKVFIHSAEDLPKVKGEYFVHRKIAEKLTSFLRFAGDGIEYENALWMRSVDWYLQPIEQPQPEKTAEEILDKFKEYWNKRPYERNAITLLEIDSFLQENAQFKSSRDNTSQVKSFQLSDEEIEKRALELLAAGIALKEESPVSYTHMQVCLHEAQGLRAGAKWYRDQVQINLREELIKFIKSQKLRTILTAEEIVDEYLKRKDNNYSFETGV
jgi:hypothetical protein